MWCETHGGLLNRCDECIAELRAENERLNARVTALVEASLDVWDRYWKNDCTEEALMRLQSAATTAVANPSPANLQSLQHRAEDAGKVLP